MQTYDYFMLVVLVGATLFGFWKGFAWQIASLASFVASYFVALRFSPQLAPLFGDQAPFNRFLAMLVLYLGTSFAIWMGFRLVGGFIDRMRLKEFDRQIGALFGMAKGVLFCVAITLFAVSLLPDAQRKQIVGSRSGLYIAKLLDRAHRVMPPELHDVLHPYIYQLDAAHGTREEGSEDWGSADWGAGQGGSGGQGAGGETPWNVPPAGAPQWPGLGGASGPLPNQAPVDDPRSPPLPGAPLSRRLQTATDGQPPRR